MPEFPLVHFFRESPPKVSGRQSRPKHGLLVLDFGAAGVSDRERDRKRIRDLIVEIGGAAAVAGEHGVDRGILGGRIDGRRATGQGKLPVRS
jgi:hypothetical protein